MNDSAKLYTGGIKDEHQRGPATEFRGVQHKVAAGFPSKFARCFLSSFETGIFTKKSLSKYIGIEGETNKDKRADKVRGMKKRLASKTDKFEIVESAVHNVKFERHLEQGQQLDYFCFDICGNMNPREMKWFFNSQIHFADGMRLPVTLKAINRQGKRIKEALSLITNETYYRKVLKKLKGVPNYGFLGATEEMLDNVFRQVFALIVSMPSKIVEIKQINIYKNSDINNMSSYMVFLDIVLHDCEQDVRYFNILNRVMNHVGMKLSNERKVRQSKNDVTQECYAERLGILTEKDLNKLESPGIKAVITRWANQNDTTSGRIIGGIRRFVTCRNR